MNDDELCLPRAIRNLRNHLRAADGILNLSPTDRGWWDSIKAEERLLVRAFSELRAEQPTDPGPITLGSLAGVVTDFEEDEGAE